MEQTPPHTEEGPRILVVDDEPDLLFLLRRVLKRRAPGCAIDPVGDAPAALARLAEGPLPAVVLLDLNLPGMHGLDLLALLRGDERTRSLPVVIWSGTADPATREEALRIGVSWFAVKPSGFAELESFLDRVLALAGVAPLGGSVG